jgi:hypothetical protein
MKSLCLWLFGALLLGPPGSLWAQQLMDVTFQADLNIGINSGQFNPDEDRVLLRGSFNDWGMETEMSDINGTGIFTVTVPVEAGSYDYKFFIDGGLNITNDGWESGDNRPLEVTEPEILNPVLFRTTFNTQSVEFDGYVHLYADNPFIGQNETSVEFELGILSSSDSLVHALEFDLTLLADIGNIIRIDASPQAVEAGWELRYFQPEENTTIKVAFAGTDPIPSGAVLATVEVSGIDPQNEPVMLGISEVIVNEEFYGFWNVSDGLVSVRSPVSVDSLDLNDDEQINGDDVFFLANMLVQDRHIPVSDEMKVRADLTQNGELTMLDAYVFNQWVAYGVDPSEFVPQQPVVPEIDFTGTVEGDSVTFSVSLGIFRNLKTVRLYTTLSSQKLTEGLYPFSDAERLGMVSFLGDEETPLFDVGMMRMLAPANQNEVFSLHFRGSLSDFQNVAAGFSDQYLVIDSLQINEQPVSVLDDTLRFDQFVVSIEDENINALPQKVTLRQNYPNPFNPNTQITVELSEAEHIRLEVFTMLGERVSVLENKFLSAGNHMFTFDAAGLSSGIYLYQLTTPTSIETRKMVLIK